MRIKPTKLTSDAPIPTTNPTLNESLEPSSTRFSLAAIVSTRSRIDLSNALTSVHSCAVTVVAVVSCVQKESNGKRRGMRSEISAQ